MNARRKTKAKKPSSRRPGRPENSRRILTKKGADYFDNEMRARLGDLHDAPPGSFWAERVWIDRHPRGTTLQKRAEAQHTTPEALIVEAKARPLADWALAQLIDAIDRRDTQFFEDAARYLRRLGSDGSLNLHDPWRSAILDSIDWSGRTKYTVTGLMDSVPWRRFGSGCPDWGYLKKMCAELGVPMRRGRPRK